MADRIRKGTKVTFRAGRGTGQGKVTAIDGRRVTIVAKRAYSSKLGLKGEEYQTTRDIAELERA